jgi:[ribosomal protein S5]-alanine N-acetyltransferase
VAGGVLLRPPTRGDMRAFVAAVTASNALHRSWVAPPSSPDQFRAWRKRMAQPTHCALLACRRDSGDIVGVFNISNMVMGPFRSAFLGYYAFAGHEGQGLMADGLRLVVRHAFKTLKLHRLEANIQPANAQSIALVKSCGFSLEGYSPRYLKVAGRWRDHERWATIKNR